MAHPSVAVGSHVKVRHLLRDNFSVMTINTINNN
mgnify:CR=1 FL=1